MNEQQMQGPTRTVSVTVTVPARKAGWAMSRVVDRVNEMMTMQPDLIGPVSMSVYDPSDYDEDEDGDHAEDDEPLRLWSMGKAVTFEEANPHLMSHVHFSRPHQQVEIKGSDEADAADEEDAAPEQDPDEEEPRMAYASRSWEGQDGGCRVLSIGVDTSASPWSFATWLEWAGSADAEGALEAVGARRENVSEVVFRLVRDASNVWLPQWRVQDKAQTPE